MKFRQHRGGLDDSMGTVVEIAATREGLAGVISLATGCPRPNPGDIEVEFYAYDERIGWQTYIVTLKGEAVGFTDGPIDEQDG